MVSNKSNNYYKNNFWDEIKKSATVVDGGFII
jgi:hypothetical protein